MPFYSLPCIQTPIRPIPSNIYMNTAKTTPKPATVTKPPLWARIPGAALVDDLTVPADVVLEADPFEPFSVAEAVAEAPPFVVVAVELEALPVADALVPLPVPAAPVPEATMPAVVLSPVAVDFPAFVVL